MLPANTWNGLQRLKPGTSPIRTRQRNADERGAAGAGNHNLYELSATGPQPEKAGGDAPKFTEDELKTISSPLEFVAINVYKPGWYVEPSADLPGYRNIPLNASRPKMILSGRCDRT